MLNLKQKRTQIFAGEGEPRMLAEAALLGVLGALTAQVFMWMLRGCDYLFLYKLAGYVPPGTESGSGLSQTIGSHGLWLIPLVTMLGGLISGYLVYRYAPEAEGHGTDTVVNAFHRGGSEIRTRVAPLKMVASAVTIGSGGAAGREGPIALITAALGSLYGRLTHRSEERRQLLLLAGMAAGLAAIFRSPMGTGVFAIEVLYAKLDFEPGALLYTMLSSAVAYTVNGVFVGFRPLFKIPTIPTPQFADYTRYIALGIASAVVATVLPEIFYRLRDAFRALPVPNWTKPAIGGLCVGLIALRLPQVLGGGYGWIQLAIDGRLTLSLLLVLIGAKILAFSLTVSSGGSGGVFAPSLFVGAMLGGSFALWLHQPSAVFVIVGMAAVFGAAARVPIATMLMVTEMGGGYNLLVPAGLAVMISYLVQGRLSAFLSYPSLYESQVRGRENSPAHYREHIRIALNLLSAKPVPPLENLPHLNLLGLLRSRLRFDLPGGRMLTMGVAHEGSPLIGKTVGWLYQELTGFDFEIIAIARREHVLLPHRDTLLKAGDGVLVLASAPDLKALAQYIAPAPEPQESQEGRRSPAGSSAPKAAT